MTSRRKVCPSLGSLREGRVDILTRRIGFWPPVSRAYLATIETPATAPHHRIPSRHALGRLAKALGINVGELVA